MLKACEVVGNRDLEPFIPGLVACIVKVAETPDIVHRMSATTFVQAIEAPALAIMVPFLVRGPNPTPPQHHENPKTSDEVPLDARPPPLGVHCPQTQCKDGAGNPL